MNVKDIICSGVARFLSKIYAPEFVGKLTGNADTSTKATQDSAGQQINTTYIKGLSVSGRTITYTKGNGATGTITTQDTVYTHPATSGNKHIPAGGASGQILRWSADGAAVWGADNNTTYGVGTASALGLTKLYTGTGTATDGTMTQKAITDSLNGKAASSHSHTYASITNKPDILNCLRMYGGTALDSKGTTSDSNAQYAAIALSTATANTSGFSKALTDLPKGKYSVMIRMKMSAITSTANVIKIQCGGTSALKTFYVKPNMFTTANVYQTFGFTVEHTTTSFTANLSIGTALSGSTVTIDYLAIAPIFTAISSVS